MFISLLFILQFLLFTLISLTLSTHSVFGGSGFNNLYSPWILFCSFPLLPRGGGPFLPLPLLPRGGGPFLPLPLPLAPPLTLPILPLPVLPLPVLPLPVLPFAFDVSLLEVYGVFGFQCNF